MQHTDREAMPAKALEAIAWEYLPGIQVNFEQGPQRHNAFTQRGVCWYDFKLSDRACESYFGIGCPFDVL